MHISKEFLMEAVGLSLLVALIFISMQMFQRAVKISTLLNAEQEEKILMLEEYEIVKYEGLLMDGLTAVGYIKKMVENYELPIVVKNGTESFDVTKREDFELLRNIDSEKYISPYAIYRCWIVRDENKVITEIKLLKEQEGS